MTHTRPPCPPDCFDRQWRLVENILRGVTIGLGPVTARYATLHPGTWQIVHRELTLAETLIRRLLVLLAAAMTPFTPRASAPRKNAGGKHTPTPAAPAEHAAPPRPCVPLFCLTEPGDRPLTETHAKAPPPSGPPPRFWVLGMPALYPPLPARAHGAPQRKTLAPRDTRALLRRFAALQDVLAHPGKHTARMAGWIAARRAAQADSDTSDRRSHPIRLGSPPGVTRKRLAEAYVDVCQMAQHARIALLRPPGERAPPDTS